MKKKKNRPITISINDAHTDFTKANFYSLREEKPFCGGKFLNKISRI